MIGTSSSQAVSLAQVHGLGVSPSGFISLNFSSDNVLCQKEMGMFGGESHGEACPEGLLTAQQQRTVRSQSQGVWRYGKMAQCHLVNDMAQKEQE